MHSQDDIIGPLISSNQSEKCLKLGTLTCVVSHICRPSMTVHEQLVWFRGRCPFKHYIPSKPDKYGINLRTICHPTCSYTWKMQVYIRKDAGLARETKQGQELSMIWQKILIILAGNIICDSFFTNLSLAQKLL